MSILQRAQVLLLILFLFLLSACSTSKIPSLPSPSSFKKASSEESKDLIELFTKDREDLSSFQGTVQLSINKSLFQKKTNIALAYSYPDSLRAEILPTNFATPVALVLAKDKELSFIDRQNLEAWVGDISPERVENMLGLPLGINEFIHWLSASWLVNEMSFKEAPVYGFETTTEKPSKNIKFYINNKKETALVYLELSSNRQVRLLLSGLKENPFIVSSDLWSGGERRVYTVYDYNFSQKVEGLPEDSIDETKSFLPVSSDSWLIQEDAKVSLNKLTGELSPEWSDELNKKLFSVKVPRKFKIKPLTNFRLPLN